MTPRRLTSSRNPGCTMTACRCSSNLKYHSCHSNGSLNTVLHTTVLPTYTFSPRKYLFRPLGSMCPTGSKRNRKYVFESPVKELAWPQKYVFRDPMEVR